VTHVHKINKKKADAMEEYKYTEIERENRILFEKIAKISTKKSIFSKDNVNVSGFSFNRENQNVS
jgi:hypothetical protein